MNLPAKYIIMATLIASFLSPHAHASKKNYKAKSSHREAKELVSTSFYGYGPKYMYLVNEGIKKIPHFMVNAWAAKKLAQSILKTIEKSENKGESRNVQDFINLLVEKLNLFLEPARCLPGSLIVVPLLKESLGTCDKETGVPILVQLFDSDEKAESFLSKKIPNKKALIQLCDEFVIFFNDLKKSLSEKALESYKKAKQKVLNPINRKALS
ncbi:MAG: hypothetical protein ABH827_04205 [bacterium]